MIAFLACAPLLIWIYLMLGRGMFWLCRERDDRDLSPEPSQWPSVRAVVPARNEADVIGRSIASLLDQDYPGAFEVILVDDDSADGTALVAAQTAEHGPEREALTIQRGAPLPTGWTGKLWAMKQGVETALGHGDAPKYLLLTDADIAHAPDNLRRLVARAEAGNLVLTSLMAKLSCANWAERLLIPAFVYFFDMVYPFAFVNNPRNRLGGAAGGCMLVRTDALAAAGGVETIRTAIIDDCTLGAAMKPKGPIWLGLTERAQSLRPYEGFRAIGAMVSRSAYAQLSYSPILLVGVLAGLALTFLAAPLVALLAAEPWRWAGLAAWLLMALSFLPILRFYKLSPFRGLLLPIIGAAYGAFTLKSAIDVWLGRGGQWKGRAQAMAGETS